MITKMTQYSFILLSGEQEAFMEKLRTLGVMDVTRSAKPVDETSSSMFAKSDECKKVLGKLENVDYSKDADLDAINTVAADQTKVSFGQDDPLKAFTETSFRLEELGQRLQMLRKEYEEQLPWGTFDEKKIKALAEQGYKTRFYKVQSKIFDEQWADSYPLQVISENGPFTWFVTVSDDPHYDFPIDECNLPSGSFKDTAAKMEKSLLRSLNAKANYCLSRGCFLRLRKVTMKDYLLFRCIWPMYAAKRRLKTR
jgi:V/A-type H+-transporting ATPase subunit I